MILLSAVWTVFRGFVRIDNNFRAVVRTKFSGLSDKIYYPGLYFFPERAIPGYCKIKLYPQTETPITETINVDLPFKSALAHIGNFTLKYRVKMNFEFTENALRVLFKKNLYQEEIAKLRASLVEAENLFLSTKFINNIPREKEPITEEKLFKSLNAYTVAFIKAHYKILKDVSLSYFMIYFPDIDLYKKNSAGLALSLEQQTAEFLRKMNQLNYEKRYNAAVTEMEIERLKKYVELIKKEKSVLNLMFLQRLSDKIRVIVLPSDKFGVNMDNVFSMLRNQEVQRTAIPRVNTPQPVTPAPAAPPAANSGQNTNR